MTATLSSLSPVRRLGLFWLLVAVLALIAPAALMAAGEEKPQDIKYVTEIRDQLLEEEMKQHTAEARA